MSCSANAYMKVWPSIDLFRRKTRGAELSYRARLGLCEELVREGGSVLLVSIASYQTSTVPLLTPHLFLSIILVSSLSAGAPPPLIPLL